MPLITRSNSGPARRGPNLFDGLGYAVTHVPRNVITAPGAISNPAINDAVERRHATADYYQVGTLGVTLGAVASQGVSYEALTPSIATIDQKGQITRVSDGNALFAVRRGQRTATFQLDVSEISAGTNVLEATSWAAGSLGADAAANLDALIAGKNEAQHKRLYSLQNHPARQFTRNADCWAHGVPGITACSVSNTARNNQITVTMISPRHGWASAHFMPAPGTICYFVGLDNALYARTVVGIALHPDYDEATYEADIGIVTFDSDLPPAVGFVKIFPANWSNYLIELERARLPCLCLDQEENALVTEWVGVNGYSADMGYSIDPQRNVFYENKVGGDSDNPTFAILDLGIGPELVLVGTWSFGLAGQMSFSGFYAGIINALIAAADATAAVSTGYTVTFADFAAAGFTDFS